MLLTIESVKLSKSGKSYWVIANGKGYSSKAKGIEQLSPGQAIEATTGSFKIGNDTVDSIDGFTLATGVVAPSSSLSAQLKTEPALTPSVDRYWIQFVSNQVAHAIAAGLIKQPHDMSEWAKAAYQAVNNADDIAF
jgi:hypothetical protein